MKKGVLLVAALAIAIATVPMFAAFEAHIINVTAQIENALTVDTTHIDFGTVFPQEILHEFVCVSLSDSFLEEERVDDVQYVIKQKPKVKGDPYGIITLPTGEEVVAHEYCLEALAGLNDPADLSDPYYDYCYPNLAPQLSKHKAENDNYNPTDVAPYDVEVDAPNANWATEHAEGYLSKIMQDVTDHWDIDLVVPCFEGMCDQDYDPAVYGEPLDPALEHATFGADLWLEVTGISESCVDCI